MIYVTECKYQIILIKITLSLSFFHLGSADLEFRRLFKHFTWPWWAAQCSALRPAWSLAPGLAPAFQINRYMSNHKYHPILKSALKIDRNNVGSTYYIIVIFFSSIDPLTVLGFALCFEKNCNKMLILDLSSKFLQIVHFFRVLEHCVILWCV